MRRVLFSLLGWLFALGCGGGTLGEGESGSGDTTEIVLNLQYDVVDQGGSLVLLWDNIEDATEYRVYVDENLLGSTQATSYTITENNAGAKVWVEALLPDTAAAETLDIAGGVVKSSVSDWGEYSSNYCSAVGFTDGQAVTYSVTDEGNYSNFEIIADDGEAGVNPSEIDLCSPNIYSPPFNDHDNGFADWPGGIVAPAPGNYRLIYPDAGGVQQGGSYAAWLDPTADGWSPDDHFVRMDIANIGSDGQVQATFYYQTIGGLRWVPVE